MKGGFSGFNPEHLYLTPEFEHATDVVGAMCDLYLGDLGWMPDELPSADRFENACNLLAHLSLSDMLNARQVVEQWNERPAGPGGKTFMCVPEDRLIAAIYTLVHYTYCAPPDENYTVVERRTPSNIHSLQVRSWPVRMKKPESVAA